MKKILMSLAVVVGVGAIVAGATGAFFSDTETSSGNTFSAGAIDLQIDNTSYYNGEFNDETSWSLKNLEEGDLFFNFLDLKPGDWGEDTISVHVDDNDAWACMDAELTATDDNGLTEPEEADGDTTGGDGEGELQNFVNFVWWADDGDNVLESCPATGGVSNCVDETDRVFHTNVTLAEFDNFGVALADSTGNGVLSEGPLEGGTTHYIGKAWCFGDFTLNAVEQDGQGFVANEGANGPDVRDAGIVCDGSPTDNTAQTDSVVGNLSFRVEQSRNNESFTCGNGGIGCVEKADVMLVLDSSGSIDSTELADLQDAAKAFVAALSPSTDGVHVGVVDFDDDATLELGLSGDESSINNVIDNNLTSGGNTNLEDGIRTAQQELDDNGRGDADHFMVIITDGEPTAQDEDPNDGDGTDEGEAEDAATDAKNDGTELFAVGVGNNLDASFLQNDIVSAPSSSHYFDAEDFEDLEAILAGLTECEGEIANGS